VVVNTAAEEVLHLLPPVKTLRVVLVGPEFKVITTGPQVFKHFDKEVCPPCSRIGAKRILTIYR
jgi:splicing suppressor protein 51